MSTNTEIIFQRSLHDKENPYAQISRNLIRDSSISPSCRWMLMYFLSMRDDFSIKIKQLCDHVQPFVGRDSVYDLITEAINAGYMKREDKFRGNLKAGCIYYISESPCFKKCLRHPDPQYTETRGPENQEALRKNLKKENLKEEEITTPTPSKGKRVREISPPLEKYGKFVQMKKEDHEGFVSAHGEPLIKELIDEMNDYLASNGKRYQDYAAAMRQWIKRRKNNPQQGGYSKATTSDIDKELAEKIMSKFPRERDIKVGSNYIEFHFGPMNVPHIKFGDKAFREQVIHNLRKMNLSIQDL